MCLLQWCLVSVIEAVCSVFVTESVPRLVSVIEAVDARAVENLNPTENAISAVTKICRGSVSTQT